MGELKIGHLYGIVAYENEPVHYPVKLRLSPHFYAVVAYENEPTRFQLRLQMKRFYGVNTPKAEREMRRGRVYLVE